MKFTCSKNIKARVLNLRMEIGFMLVACSFPIGVCSRMGVPLEPKNPTPFIAGMSIKKQAKPGVLETG